MSNDTTAGASGEVAPALLLSTALPPDDVRTLMKWCADMQTWCESRAALARAPLPARDLALTNDGREPDWAAYAAAEQAQADDARDAARYQYLRNQDEGIEFRDGNGKWRADCPSGEELDTIIDASIAASLAGKDKQ